MLEVRIFNIFSIQICLYIFKVPTYFLYIVNELGFIKLFNYHHNNWRKGHCIIKDIGRFQYNFKTGLSEPYSQ